MDILVFDKNYEDERSDYLTVIQNNLDGYNINLFTNYNEAIISYKKNLFHIVLIDFTTDEGKAFLQDVNKLNSLQRIITMGFTLSCSSEMGCLYCIDNFYKRRLLKPIDAIDLYKTIKDFNGIFCKYANRFNSPKLLLDELIKRYKYFSYDEKNEIISSDKNDLYELKELLNLMVDLKNYGIKYEVIDDKSLKVL
ncbi:hypothetical protein [Arcobacter sp. LA11]|uniref:hypothetical protein n=1 Tax=Arcobacter sp. LA11 TaxID=1898176 RepID=UPI000934C575|nr:hypothetical protein [Arcobacter sp. LA11]